MRAKIWGCRGSLAAPGPETIRYGGNTSCLEIRPSDGRMLVIDAGTGIRNLGVSLRGDHPARVDILLTHLHLDHIEGMGFFGPIWDPNCEVHIWGPPSPTHSLRDRVATYFSPPLFPVHIDELPSHLEFHDVPQTEWELGSASIRGDLVKHPGPTLGYQVEDGGRVLTYISDHEPALGIDLENVPPEEEYPHRVGWGHSSIAHTISFALIAKVQRLFMFHHDPLHSDDQLESMLGRAKELWRQDQDGLALSFEGMEIDVT